MHRDASKNPQLLLLGCCNHRNLVMELESNSSRNEKIKQASHSARAGVERSFGTRWCSTSTSELRNASMHSHRTAHAPHVLRQSRHARFGPPSNLKGPDSGSDHVGSTSEETSAKSIVSWKVHSGQTERDLHLVDLTAS